MNYYKVQSVGAPGHEANKNFTGLILYIYYEEGGIHGEIQPEHKGNPEGGA